MGIFPRVVIVQIHESVKGSKVGDRVAFMSNFKYGSYGQYCFAPQASTISNPFIVLQLFNEAKVRGAQAVVQTPGASALGKMFVKYFQDSGINVINIVRRDEQITILQKEGAKYILNSSTATFLQDLKRLATQMLRFSLMPLADLQLDKYFNNYQTILSHASMDHNQDRISAIQLQLICYLKEKQSKDSQYVT